MSICSRDKVKLQCILIGMDICRDALQNSVINKRHLDSYDRSCHLIDFVQVDLRLGKFSDNDYPLVTRISPRKWCVAYCVPHSHCVSLLPAAKRDVQLCFTRRPKLWLQMWTVCDKDAIASLSPNYQPLTWTKSICLENMSFHKRLLGESRFDA